MVGTSFIKFRKFIKYFLFITYLFLCACNSYNTQNERTYTIPKENNLYDLKSLEALNDATKNYPNDPEGYYKKALYYTHKQSWEDALENAQKAVSLDSTQKKHYYILAKVYQEIDSLDQALSAARKAEQNTNNSLETLIKIAELYLEKKQYKQASIYLTRSNTLSKKDPRIYYLKGNLALERYDTTNALKNLRIALKQKPDYVEAYHTMGKLYFQFEMKKTAMKWIDKGLEYDAKFPLLNFTKAEIFRQNRFMKDSANFYYQKAFEQDNKLYMASYYLGKYAFDKGNYKKAQDLFEKTLALEAKFANANYYLGICYYYKRRFKDALTKFKTTIDLDTKNLAASDLYWKVKSILYKQRQREIRDSLRRNS